MPDYKKIAKEMEKDFRKKDIRCPKCNSHLKFKAVMIDNIETESIAVSCDKCGYMYYEPVTRKLAIKEVKLAYAGNNKKIMNRIISHLKKGINIRD